jgi:nucleotide-binding universal stress UspA family protein
MRTIVVGTDGSPVGEQALREAIELAARLEATLHVVSAYRIPAQRRDAQAVLARARRIAYPAGRRAITHARRDHPAEALIAVAEAHDADLIVVGGKGMTAAARFLLGSIADQVARHAPCNVLIVRAA